MMLKDMIEFKREQNVRIDTGDVVFDGKIRAVISMNRKNTSDEDRLCHNYIVVNYNDGEVDTVARFYQRRSGHILNSRGWTLEAE